MVNQNEEPYTPRLDTAEGCVAELAACNREIAGISADWAEKAGQLKRYEKRYARLYKEGLKATKGKNKEERDALAHSHAEEAHRQLLGLEDDEAGLSDIIEALTEDVESYRTTFNVIDRRSGNVQSILKLRREEGRLDLYVPRDASHDPEPAWRPR